MKLHDGCTGLTAIIRDNKILVANVGDCRALLISNGRPIPLSTDQKPTSPEEQKRIAALGGTVVYCMGVARVNRVLAVSRAFGNRTLRQVIRPDAELLQKELVEGDDFLVMASDGLWDVLKNKDVSDICYSSFLQRKPQAIAEELVNTALARGSMDNVTCIVVNLTEFHPKEGSTNHDNALKGKRNSSDDLSDSFFDDKNNGDFGNTLVGSLEAGTSIIFDEHEGTTELDITINQMNDKKRSSKPSSGSNSNNNILHEAGPNRQHSLGSFNPQDLPSIEHYTDNSSSKKSLQGDKKPFLKATSTNSIHNLFETTPNHLNNFLVNYGNNENNNNTLRPLTVVEAFSASAPLVSSSGSTNPPNNGRPMSRTISDVIGQQKAALPNHIRSIRNNNNNNMYDNHLHDNNNHNNSMMISRPSKRSSANDVSNYPITDFSNNGAHYLNTLREK